MSTIAAVRTRTPLTPNQKRGFLAAYGGWTLDGMDAFIYALVVSGVFAVEGSVFHVFVVLGFGMLGYVLRMAHVPVLPMVLGVVLGFMVESNYRRSLVLSSGDHMTFVEDPLAAGLLVAAALVVTASLARHIASRANRRVEV